MNKAPVTTTAAAKNITHMVDASGKVFGVSSTYVKADSVVLFLDNHTVRELSNEDYTTSEMSTDRGVTFFTPKFDSVSLYW